MSYIKKEDALAVVMSVWKDADYDAHPLSEVYDRITRLPVFEPYQKKGMWLINEDDFGTTFECSECHIEGMIAGNFCYCCGAKMLNVPDINDGKTATAKFYAEVERETALLMREEGTK